MQATCEKKNLTEIFKGSSSEDFALHSFHIYPCKYPAYIPRQLIKQFTVPGDVVCDPFAGSGTTILEATLSGRNSIANDINPLSCLITRVKSKPVPKKTLKLIQNFNIQLKQKFITSVAPTWEYPGINHWFQKNVVHELSLIRHQIFKVKSKEARDILALAFSSIIVRASNQESDTRYEAIEKRIPPGEVVEMFSRKVSEACLLFEEFSIRTKGFRPKIKIIQEDSRILKGISDASVDLVITSPPYANTYDYYLYHKHRKHWLGLDVKFAQYNEIGSRREYSSLKQRPSKWEDDLEACFMQIKRITKPKARIFVVLGDSVIQGKLHCAKKLVKKICQKTGLKFENSASELLSRNSKMFNPNFRTTQTKREHLIQLVR